MCESESHSVLPASLRPHVVHSWGQNTGVGSLSLLQGIFPGIEPISPALQADSLSAEPQGKPKNNGVGSLSLLQGIFPTQESNWGLLHGRWILYQLSYEGGPLNFYSSSISLIFKCDISLICTVWYGEQVRNEDNEVKSDNCLSEMVELKLETTSSWIIFLYSFQYWKSRR